MIDYKKVKQIYFYSNELDMRSGMKRIQMLLSVNFSPAELVYTLFIFCSKNRKQIKIYYEDEYGSWLLINKLNYSNFHWPREIQTGGYEVSDLKMLLKGLKIMEERQKEIGY